MELQNFTAEPKHEAIVFGRRLTCDRVTLVTSLLHPGEGEGLTTLYPLLRDCARRGVAVIDRAPRHGDRGPDGAPRRSFCRSVPPSKM